MQKLFAIVALALLVASLAAADEAFCPLEGAGVCPVGPSEIIEQQQVVNTTKYENTTCVIYFYGDGCSKCAEIKPFIKQIEEKYCDRIHVNWLEVYHNSTNYALYDEYATRVGIPMEKRGIPFVIVGKTYLMGVDKIKENMESVILDESNMGICPFPGQLECHPYDPTQVSPPEKREITLPLVISAGLIDSINPCAFAVLIFLLAFLAEVSGSRRRMIKAAIAYIIAVYASYFLAGLGIISIISLTGYANTVSKAAAAVAILAGLINIKDYFWYGKGISLQIPASQKKNIESLVRKANVPAAVALGFLVSMVELPCTGGVYLAVLALLAESTTKASATTYLVIYNIMFILPLIIITLLVIVGMKAHHLEEWRQGKREWMKLALGLFMVALGVWMLV